MENNELQHSGIKGMRWGIRRYQNKDGSLTEAGKKRYNQEVEKLKAEEAKVKAAEKVAATKKRTQAKFDKLDAKKQELDARKKALKGKTDDSDKKNSEETVKEKRERLLKSTDAKEIYKDKDVLTDAELQGRLNRMNLESQVLNKVPVETKKTGIDYMNSAKANIDAASNLYKSVDNAFSTVTNSTIGKTLAKNLGIEVETKKEFNLNDFVKNINKKSNQEIQDAANRVRNQEAIEEAAKKLSKTKIDNVDAIDYEEFYKNISSKSDKDVQRAAQRAENEAKILNNKKKISEARREQVEQDKKEEETEKE